MLSHKLSKFFLAACTWGLGVLCGHSAAAESVPEGLVDLTNPNGTVTTSNEESWPEGASTNHGEPEGVPANVFDFV